MSDLPTRNQIKPGTEVGIETKENQGTGKFPAGIVKEILTSSNVHPHGIKVELEDGQVGRVKELFANTGNVIMTESEKTSDGITTKEYTKVGPGLDFTTGFEIIANDDEQFVDKSSNIDTPIPKDEDEWNEFKSTFRVDYDRFSKGDGKKVHHKDVEKEIPITVSAMANKEGGTLFVGVDDDGNMLGLENDYDLLKNPNDDKFQRIVWQTIQKYIGNKPYVSKLNISLIEKNLKKICVITIPPADEPIVVHDNNTQESYVRIGPKSEKFAPLEFMKYCKKRFDD